MSESGTPRVTANQLRLSAARADNGYSLCAEWDITHSPGRWNPDIMFITNEHQLVVTEVQSPTLACDRPRRLRGLSYIGFTPKSPERDSCHTVRIRYLWADWTAAKPASSYLVAPLHLHQPVLTGYGRNQPVSVPVALALPDSQRGGLSLVEGVGRHFRSNDQTGVAIGALLMGGEAARMRWKSTRCCRIPAKRDSR